MTAHVPLAARAAGRWSREISEKLDAALDSFNWDGSAAYGSLSELAQSVEITGHMVDGESAIVTGNHWTCPGTVFVSLGYDVNSKEPVYIQDSYPISVQFEFDGSSIDLVAIEADTSSFYE